MNLIKGAVNSIIGVYSLIILTLTGLVKELFVNKGRFERKRPERIYDKGEFVALLNHEERIPGEPELEDDVS